MLADETETESQSFSSAKAEYNAKKNNNIYLDTKSLLIGSSALVLGGLAMGAVPCLPDKAIILNAKWRSEQLFSQDFDWDVDKFNEAMLLRDTARDRLDAFNGKTFELFKLLCSPISLNKDELDKAIRLYRFLSIKERGVELSTLMPSINILVPVHNPSAEEDLINIQINFAQIYNKALMNKALGSGSFGKVYSFEWRGKEYVFKEPYPDTPNQLVASELAAIESIPFHPNIVRSIGAIKYDDTWYLIQERTGDDLSAYLQSGKIPNSVEVLGVLQGLEYMHRRGFVHRDLKPENLVMSGDKSRILLTDFGFSESLRGRTYQGQGTQDYLPPEIIALALPKEMNLDLKQFFSTKMYMYLPHFQNYPGVNNLGDMMENLIPNFSIMSIDEKVLAFKKWEKNFDDRAEDVYSLGITLQELDPGAGSGDLKVLIGDMTSLNPADRPGMTLVIKRYKDIKGL